MIVVLLALLPAAARAAGTNIGNAQLLTSSASGTLGSALADDWYVIYPSDPATPVRVEVDNTTPSGASGGCQEVTATMDNTDGGAVAGITLLPTQTNATNPFSATGSERYYVELNDSDCNPGSGPAVSYTVRILSGAGGTPPSPSSGSAAPGTSIGDAWPALQGDTSYTGSIPSAIADHWYVLYKRADANQATIRVEDTTASAPVPGCAELTVTLDDKDGSTLGGITLLRNQAHTFAFADAGPHFLELTDSHCNPGTMAPVTYRIEPEPASEYENPPEPPMRSITPGGSMAQAAGPLAGATTYNSQIANASVDGWFEFDANGTVPQVVVRVADTTPRDAQCPEATFVLHDAGGSSLGGITLLPDQAHEFVVNPAGRYYIEATDAHCDPTEGSGPSIQIYLQPASGIGQSGSGGQSPFAVVLVTGLRDSHVGTAPGGNCFSVGSMAQLCSALELAGFPVYVPSSSTNGGAVLDNRASYDYNARALASYVQQYIHTGVFLVGHSNGGVASRIAISRYHLGAVGLYTIGSPFDGSFGADIAEDARTFPCFLGPICLLLHRAGNLAEQAFGADALRDLTSEARAADNATLGPTGVPTWTFAGTACPGPPLLNLLSRYVFPNDGIVGISSAFGESAGLGPSTRQQGDDYHAAILQQLFGSALPLPGCHAGSPLELSDPVVIGKVLAAANSLRSGGARDLAGARMASRVARPLRLVLNLQTGATRSLRAGSSVPANGAVLLSPNAFTLTCHGRSVPALTAIGGRVFGIPAGTLSCRHATLNRSARLAIASDPDRVRATVIDSRGRVTITVTAARAIKRLVLARGHSLLRVRQRRHGSRRIQIALTPAQASELTLSAIVAHRSYSTTLPMRV